MYIRRKNCEYGRIKRSSRKTKACDSFSNNFGSYFKLLLLWAAIMALDFLMEFRFEYMWPCWLLISTINDSFKYQGMAFAVFFTLISLTSDLICFMLIPSSWLFLFGSTCVWIELVWHADRAFGPSDVGHMMGNYVATTVKSPVNVPINVMSKLERGMCVPTIALCFFFLYMEVAVRLRDPKTIPLSIDICRPFAAHCIGYPVVTLGFGLKSLLSHQFRLRKQQSVQAQNLKYFCLLESALPEEARALNRAAKLTNGQAHPAISHTPIPPSNTINNSLPAITFASTGTTNSSTTTSGEKTTSSSRSTRKHNQQQNHQQHLSNGKTISEVNGGRSGNSQSVTDHLMERRSFCAVEGNFFTHQEADSTSQLKSDGSPSVCSTASNSSNDSETAVTSSGGSSLSGQEEAITSIDRSSSVSVALKSANSTNNSCGGGNKKNASSSTAAPSHKGRSGAESSKTSNGGRRSKDSSVQNMEDELRKLRNQCQSMMVADNDLRSQVAQLSAIERASRTEITQARQEVENLQSKVANLSQRLLTEKENLQAIEKRLTDERQQRTSLEQQLANEKRARKETEEKSLLTSSTKSSSLATSSSQPVSKAVNKSVGANRIGSSLSSSNQRAGSCASEICNQRMRDLESQVKLVTRELAQKEAQLASLQASLPPASFFPPTERQQKMQAMHQQLHKEDHRRVNDLSIQLNELQAENVRLKVTLKAEDKMKQELLTGYHTSLKEITELNSTLTRKEYQIVDLNMRLDMLNPSNLYNYMNLMDSSNKSPDSSTISGQRTTRDLMSPSSSNRYTSSGRPPPPYINGYEPTFPSNRNSITSGDAIEGLFSDSVWPFSSPSISSPSSVAVTAPSSSSSSFQYFQQHRHMQQPHHVHQNSHHLPFSSSSSFDPCDFQRIGSNNGFSTVLPVVGTGEDEQLDSFSAAFGKNSGMTFNMPPQTTLAASPSSCISSATTAGSTLSQTAALSSFLSSTHTTDVESMSTPAFLNQLRSQLNVNTSSATSAVVGCTSSPVGSPPVELVGLSKAVRGPVGSPVGLGVPTSSAIEVEASTGVDAGGDGELVS